MSWTIGIVRAKPNPFGKDVTSSGTARPAQLLGEWVDLANSGDQSVNLSMLHLTDAQFSPTCEIKHRAVEYWTGKSTDVLAPGQIVRVHTGKSGDAYVMPTDDGSGVHIHAFAERGWFVLNNRCGDIISVWWIYNGQWTKEDEASYDPNPPEGAILRRVGNRLIL